VRKHPTVAAHIGHGRLGMLKNTLSEGTGHKRNFTRLLPYFEPKMGVSVARYGQVAAR